MNIWKQRYDEMIKTCVLTAKQRDEAMNALRVCYASAMQVSDEWLASQPEGIGAAINCIGKRLNREAPTLKQPRPCWHECSCGWKGPQLATWKDARKPDLLFCGGCKESALPSKSND